jgi:membrane associated rhomboid family serine protease
LNIYLIGGIISGLIYIAVYNLLALSPQLNNISPTVLGASAAVYAVMFLLINPPFGEKEKIKPIKIRDKKTPALMSMSCTNVFPFLNGLFMSSMKLATVNKIYPFFCSNN